MRFFRVGDKVISREKLFEMVSDILSDRERGATQEETAVSHGVQRSFVSFLESLGEVRRGPRVALVGFPVSNGDAVKEMAERFGVEFVLLLSQSEREEAEGSSVAEVFNRVLDTLAELTTYDVIVLLASDKRINTIERILGREVVPMLLGSSPLANDVAVDLDELESVLEGVTEAQRRAGSRRPKASSRSKRAGSSRGRGGRDTGRWGLSKRS